MMGRKSKTDRSQIEMLSLDDLVPKNHLVRKLEVAIDLSFIYDEVKDLYKPYGRESIDPVVLIKIAMIQYIFGIRSMRQTIKEIEVNMAYRWYIGYGMYEEIPHFSTFGKNYARRFKDTDLFENIFARILKEIEKYGFIDDENIFIDGTHIKANANNHKSKNELIKQSARCYEEELQREITSDRAMHGKKPLKEKEMESPVKNSKTSTTDPESGLFHKGEHKKVFAYSANTACDKNNYILGFHVTPGNVHDSVSFWELYKKLKEERSGIRGIVVDSGYKIPAIVKRILDDGKLPITPYKCPMTKEGFFKKYEYAYDEYFDCYICPNNKILKYTTTSREGYREYKSDKNDCKDCPYRTKCTNSKEHVKVVCRHIWEHYMERAEDIRHTIGIKQIYSLRSQTIERVFADAKEKHGMRYTQYRGIKKVRMELNLLFSCMNLKKLATWLDRLGMLPPVPNDPMRKKYHVFKYWSLIERISKMVLGTVVPRTILSTV
jgi:transposase